MTHEKSFENIRNWIRNIEENASADVEKMILGNKCDLEESRVVTRERGQMLAAEHSIKFFETSAKSGLNVEEAFLTLARDIKDKMDKPNAPAQSDDNVRVQDSRGAEEKKGGCC